MAELKWIKIKTDIFTNPKITKIRSMPNGDSMFSIWIILLCLAGKTSDGGNIYLTKEIPFSVKDLKNICGKSEKFITKTLQIFDEFGMIFREKNFIKIKNWDEYQETEKKAKKRELTRERVAKHRAKKEGESPECNADVTQNVTHLVTPVVTQCNATEKEGEKELEEDIYIIYNGGGGNNNNNNNMPLPPTAAEIKGFISENKLHVSAERFISYYSRRGWISQNGVNVSAEWRTILREWESNEFVDSGMPESEQKAGSFDTDDFFEAALARSYGRGGA